ncbi:hypothetical protein [Acrocarpospora sp. B8E8]|uniref:hypothetical protein n=1 Tax=Acrocarpospora sp. B8E8 TaxID=3153572 RepID=UPI00325DBAAD
MADDLRQRYAEALARRFTSRSLMANFLAENGHWRRRPSTVGEVADVVLAVRDEEMDTLRATFARVDALHQPVARDAERPGGVHRIVFPPVRDCVNCEVKVWMECSNELCRSWPCSTHLALHGETEADCVHKEIRS